MNWTLEVVVVPVSDTDRSIEFYRDRVGFALDHDSQFGPETRIVQLTPIGSGCSIVFGTGMVARMKPGSLKGLQLCVSDITAAHRILADRGVPVSEVTVIGDSPHAGNDPLDYVGFVFFDDPDGNSWAVQQLPGRG